LLEVPNVRWRAGDEYWYGVRFFFGDDWQLADSVDNRQQFTSLWSFRYVSVDNGTGSVKVIQSPTGPRLFHTRAALSTDSYSTGGDDRIDLGPIVKGRWINLVAHFKWSTSDGVALKEFWRDGQLMGRSTLRNMHVDEPVMNRIGIYQGTAVDHTRTLHWDNHRIGRSFEAVDPTS